MEYNFNPWELFTKYTPVVAEQQDVENPFKGLTSLSDWMNQLNFYSNYRNLETPTEAPTEVPAAIPTESPTPTQLPPLPSPPVLVLSKKRLLFDHKERSIDEVIDTLRSNSKHPTKHYCTRYVVNALRCNRNWNAPSGVAGPKELAGMLKLLGWKDVLTSDYKPQKGDVWTVWGPSSWGLKNMHSSMYDGEKWISYQAENTTPWYWNTRGKKDVQAHVWRGLR